MEHWSYWCKNHEVEYVLSFCVGPFIGSQCASCWSTLCYCRLQSFCHSFLTICQQFVSQFLITWWLVLSACSCNCFQGYLPIPRAGKVERQTTGIKEISNSCISRCSMPQTKHFIKSLVIYTVLFGTYCLLLFNHCLHCIR